MRTASLTSSVVIMCFLGCGGQQKKYEEEISKKVLELKILLIEPPITSPGMGNRIDKICEISSEIGLLRLKIQPPEEYANESRKDFNNRHLSFYQKHFVDIVQPAEQYFRRIAAESRKKDGHYPSGLRAYDRDKLTRLYNSTLGLVRLHSLAFLYFEEIGMRFIDGKSYSY